MDFEATAFFVLLLPLVVAGADSSGLAATRAIRQTSWKVVEPSCLPFVARPLPRVVAGFSTAPVSASTSVAFAAFADLAPFLGASTGSALG